MKWGQRLVGLLSLLCLGNSPVLFRLLPWAGWQKGALLILLAIFYLAWNIHPCRHAPRGRLTVLQGGYELLLTSLLCLAAQALLLCFWLHLRPLPMDWTLSLIHILHADNGDNGDQSVLQRMLPDNYTVCHALGAHCTDVILTDRLQHRRSCGRCV